MRSWRVISHVCSLGPVLLSLIKRFDLAEACLKASSCSREEPWAPAQFVVPGISAQRGPEPQPRSHLPVSSAASARTRGKLPVASGRDKPRSWSEETRFSRETHLGVHCYPRSIIKWRFRGTTTTEREASAREALAPGSKAPVAPLVQRRPFLFQVVPGIEPTASHMHDKHSTPLPRPQPGKSKLCT